MLTLTEAAALLGLSPITLRVQIRNGKMRASKKGRDWFVTPREVERYRRQSLRPPVLTGGTPSGVSSGYAVQEQGPASVDVRQTSEDG
jgi:excisionase family DNA binding protein